MSGCARRQSTVKPASVFMQMVTSTRRVVAYLPNLQAAVQHFRVFSSYDESSTMLQRHTVKGPVFYTLDLSFKSLLQLQC